MFCTLVVMDFEEIPQTCIKCRQHLLWVAGLRCSFLLDTGHINILPKVEGPFPFPIVSQQLTYELTELIGFASLISTILGNWNVLESHSSALPPRMWEPSCLFRMWLALRTTAVTQRAALLNCVSVTLWTELRVWACSYWDSSFHISWINSLGSNRPHSGFSSATEYLKYSFWVLTTVINSKHSAFADPFSQKWGQRL